MKAIVALAAEELRSDLMEVQLVSLTADTSNRKDAKIIPVIRLYFMPEERVRFSIGYQ